MAEGKTFAWMEYKIKAVIDQYFRESMYMDKQHADEWKTHYIGGVLQAALFLLPFDRYMACKMHCYEKYGYDPGGCSYGQLDINEWLNGTE